MTVAVDPRLPDKETLERLGGYTDFEIDKISEAAPLFNAMTLAERKSFGREFLQTLWPDPYEWAEKTHWILDNRQGSDTFGELVRLIPNYAQRELIKTIKKQEAAGEPIRIIILKARQLGFSTFIQSWQYARCELTAHRNSMTMSYDIDSTGEMFQKAITIRRQQWCPSEAVRDSNNLLELTNGSKFQTATAGKFNAGRSFTLHNLHCSELPFWPNASTVLTGLMQSIAKHPDTAIFIESTAQGAMGSFYDLWCRAEKGRTSYVPFFAPWFWDPEYSFPFRTEQQGREWARAHLHPEDREYQKRYNLTNGQMKWRRMKIEDDLENNPLRFQQEYPACAREAFLSSGRPRFSPELVDALMNQSKAPAFCGDIELVTA